MYLNEKKVEEMLKKLEIHLRNAYMESERIRCDEKIRESIGVVDTLLTIIDFEEDTEDEPETKKVVVMR